MEYEVLKDKTVLSDNGKILAELDYIEGADGTLIMNHTFVDESLRGKGIAKELMTRAVEHIRKEGNKVVPTCSFAVNWFEKHPEDADVLK